ncbi:hypothetical protein FF1_003328 [Malus domestica]
MANVSVLNHEQLQYLARTLYYKETEAILHTKFNSETELAKRLKDCKDGYQSALALLDAGSELEHRFRNDEARASTAQEIFGYIINGANYALQTVRNSSLRSHCVEKVREHVKLLADAIEVVRNVNDVAKEVTEYRKAMLEYTRRHQNPPSREFSRWLKGSGIKYEELVQRYQAKLKFRGRFKDLKDVQKIQVYEEIIEASGRGKVKGHRLSKVLGVAGISVFLFSAGVTVWEIYLADNPLQTATRAAVVAMSSVGGATLGSAIGVALSSCLPVHPLFVVMAGIIVSIAGAFILGDFAGWLVDLIFKSGGSTTLSTEGLRCYVAPMPDGVALARQILHHHPPKY